MIRDSKDLVDNKVSTVVAEQVPDFVRSDHPVFVKFLEVYYQWLEQSGVISTGGFPDYQLRRLTANRDPDTTDLTSVFNESFLDLMFAEVAPFAPHARILANTDKRLLLKRIKEFYLAKGIATSVKFIFRLLYGDIPVEVFEPVDYVLRTSDGNWVIESSVKVDQATLFGGTANDFVGRLITGATSGATGIVERVVQRPYSGSVWAGTNGPHEVVVRTSSLSVKKFSTGETIYTGTLDGSVNVSGSLVGTLDGSISIPTPGGGYRIGDAVSFSGGGNTAFGATGKVSQVNANGGVFSVTVLNSGAGYTENATVTIASTLGTGAVVANVTVGGLFNMDGFYKDETGLISTTRAMLQDEDYWQFNSYDVKHESSNSMEDFEGVLRDSVHLAGYELFATAIQKPLPFFPSSGTTVFSNETSANIDPTFSDDGTPDVWLTWLDSTVLPRWWTKWWGGTSSANVILSKQASITRWGENSIGVESVGSSTSGDRAGVYLHHDFYSINATTGLVATSPTPGDAYIRGHTNYWLDSYTIDGGGSAGVMAIVNIFRDLEDPHAAAPNNDWRIVSVNSVTDPSELVLNIAGDLSLEFPSQILTEGIKIGSNQFGNFVDKNNPTVGNRWTTFDPNDTFPDDGETNLAETTPNILQITAANSTTITVNTATISTTSPFPANNYASQFQSNPPGANVYVTHNDTRLARGVTIRFPILTADKVKEWNTIHWELHPPRGYRISRLLVYALTNDENFSIPPADGSGGLNNTGMGVKKIIWGGTYFEVVDGTALGLSTASWRYVVRHNAITSSGTGTTTTITLDANASLIDEFYTGMTFEFLTGLGPLGFHVITAYNGATQTITIAAPGSDSWSSGDEFKIRSLTGPA